MDIVKVQTPLFPPGGSALAYFRDKGKMYHLPRTPELNTLMGGEPKKFFYAEVAGDDLTLGREAPWQDW